jgi:hypothetical protein
MGSGPLAQPLFYQYRCTYGRLDRLCCNSSAEISAIHARLASINIKRGNLITLDLLGLPAAQPREVIDRLPSPQPITPIQHPGPGIGRAPQPREQRRAGVT